MMFEKRIRLPGNLTSHDVFGGSKFHNLSSTQIKNLKEFDNLSTNPIANQSMFIDEVNEEKEDFLIGYCSNDNNYVSADQI